MPNQFTVIRPNIRRSDFDDTGDLEQAELDAANARLAIVPFDDHDEIFAILPEADGFLAAGVCTREMIEAMPKCRAIVTISHGFDKIDLEAATEAGIPVSNTYFCHEEVANHTLALLLALTRKIVPLHQNMTEDVWDPSIQPPVTPLTGQTIGLIGLGHIGREVARRTQAFDMHVIGYDPHVSDQTAMSFGVRSVGLDDLFRQSDFLSVHAPLNDATYHIVNAERLALMKPEAYLFNTARGPLVDEAALIEALESGVIAGAGLDVFEMEPTESGNPLHQMDNVVLTPHAAGYSDTAIVRGRVTASKTMAAMLRENYPEWLVNDDVRGRTRYPYGDDQ